MFKRFCLPFFMMLAFVGIVSAQNDFPKPSHPLHIIFDTDFGPDYDDVGAITLLHSFADSGLVKILATIASSKYKNAAAAINVFNTYFNRPEIPIGVVRGNAVDLGDRQHWTDSVIRRYPHRVQHNEEVWDAMVLYRRILAREADHSVTIITVGFLTNLANLLNSAPDSISPLNGYDLVRKKVLNLVSMGGRFPEGYEFNLKEDIGATKKVLDEWPTTILFSGFEIGMKIKTGIPLIHNNRIQKSPVKDVFALCIPMAAEDSLGRMSWDETAVYVAVKGWQENYNLEKGKCEMQTDGKNTWTPQESRQARLIEKTNPERMSDVINQLIMHQPVRLQK